MNYLGFVKRKILQPDEIRNLFLQILYKGVEALKLLPEILK